MTGALHDLRWRLHARALKTVIRRSSRPVVVGPWASELGFEALYWVPFLGWLLDGVPQSRIHAITRGGAPFYPSATDLYALMSPDELHDKTVARQIVHHLQKQMVVDPWEKGVVERVVERQGLRHPIWVHPRVMYRRFWGVWAGRQPMSDVFNAADFTPQPRPPKPAGLPDRYTVVKVYGRSTFRLHPDVRQLVERIVDGLLDRMPVVVLTGAGQSTDDHLDLPIVQRSGVLTYPPVDPPVNLHVQCAILAHAQAFVGTYGGMQQTALRYRVPSLGLVTGWEGTLVEHRVLSDVVAQRTGVPFQVVDTRTVGVWSHVWGRLSSRREETRT